MNYCQYPSICGRWHQVRSANINIVVNNHVRCFLLNEIAILLFEDFNLQNLGAKNTNFAKRQSTMLQERDIE